MSRIEEYRLASGAWSPHRADAILVSPAEVLLACGHANTRIPDCYFLGTAKHESNFAINERDTEISGFQSWGIFQVSVEEAKWFGLPCDGDTLLSLQGNANVMVALATRHLRAIQAAAMSSSGPYEPRDIACYLAIAHNQGLAAAEKTIALHGLSWDAYKARNPTLRIVSSGYGDDCRPPPVEAPE